MEIKKTSFETIYDSFFVRVTDDMYMEMTELDTFKDLQNILLSSLSRFEFPRFNVFDYAEGEFEVGEYSGIESDYEEVPSIAWVDGFFNSSLTIEEINILAINMMVEWFERQIATTELTR